MAIEVECWWEQKVGEEGTEKLLHALTPEGTSSPTRLPCSVIPEEVQG